MPVTHADLVDLLKRELRFLDGGGYLSAPCPSWRSALLLEDSPTCPARAAGRRCLDQPCPWLAFVALKHQRDDVRCRQVVTGARGETVDLLYRLATPAEYEETFRRRLVAAIARLEHLAV